MMMALREMWWVPETTLRHFYRKITEQYRWFKMEASHGSLEQHCSWQRISNVRRTRPHVLMLVYGFIPGGGENFPIHLANMLVDRGLTVSMLIFETSEVNEFMRQSLNPAVSVYEAAWVVEYGADRFLSEAGVTLIHSHTVGGEMHLNDRWKIETDLRYLVTLHGSYEASELSEDMLRSIATPVDHFVYTANKNLLPLDPLALPASRFTKMPNAMPHDPLPFPHSRAEMGISDNAVVFTLVARGIVRKGWRAAVEAFTQLRERRPDQPMHLCLVGEGDEPDRHRRIYGSDKDISFLGYQSRISGIYRLSDVAIVPTRFSGESFPLCIIQALQVGKPVIASDVGEIRSMIEDSEIAAGLLIPAVRDTSRFITLLCDAMERLLDPDIREHYASGAKVLGGRYDMEKLTDRYLDLYRRLLEQPSVRSTASTNWEAA